MNELSCLIVDCFGVMDVCCCCVHSLQSWVNLGVCYNAGQPKSPGYRVTHISLTKRIQFVSFPRQLVATLPIHLPSNNLVIIYPKQLYKHSVCNCLYVEHIGKIHSERAFPKTFALLGHHSHHSHTRHQRNPRHFAIQRQNFHNGLCHMIRRCCVQFLRGSKLRCDHKYIA
jgi:hypothetical protein